MSDPESWTVQRSRLARAVKAGDWATADEARRALTEARKQVDAEKHVAALVSSWPDLTDRQRLRLAALIAPRLTDP